MVDCPLDYVAYRLSSAKMLMNLPCKTALKEGDPAPQLLHFSDNGHSSRILVIHLGLSLPLT